MSRPGDEPLDRRSEDPQQSQPAGSSEATPDDAPPSAAPENPPEPDEDAPDVSFTPDASSNITEQARSLMHQVARKLVAEGPPGWQRVDVAFAATVVASTGTAFYTDENQQLVARTTPSQEIMTLVRDHRRLSSGFGDGPWWRLLFTLTGEGRIEVDYDFGAEPFPEDQLFGPEAYRADLDAYPREKLPIWLAAHIRHAGRQLRPPEVAAARARADREAGISPVTDDHALPPLPLMVARWAVLSAAFVAVRSQWGPRLMPAMRWFEGATRSGCSLYELPGGRAVLSGGKWDAPELDAVYNRGESLPELYRGAPYWVADPVLNHRASRGLLTFCYWWDNGRWYSGDSADPDDFAEAIPGLRTADSVARIVTGLLGEQPTERQREAVGTLIAAAETGTATRDMLVEIFGEDGTFDIDNAFYQLLMGAVLSPEPIAAADAVARVARYLNESGADTASYDVEALRADRVSVGWMVYVPVEPGEIAIGRAIFYVADDGALERSSSSVAPSQYLPEFERRFRDRNRVSV
ncbi:hypothetical protein [Nocardia sp. NPDC019395]|uniref:hypothetical protein n=1 Tax=Nocardia sp. NPDC019395 TaxID=3154686 RepID=UPI003411671B